MAKKTSSSPYPTVLRWQLAKATTVAAAACDEAWLASGAYADDELAQIVLQRPECSQELLSRARTHRSPHVRAKLLSRPDLTPEMLAELLEGEKRASVLGEVLATGHHAAEVSARAAAVFAEKPTVALATELVRAPAAPASARVEAALVLLPRFSSLTGNLQNALRVLPDKILDPAALERLVLGIRDAQMLHRALRTGRCTPRAQLHVADLLLTQPLQRLATRTQSHWQARATLRELLSVLDGLAGQPAPTPELAPLAAAARLWDGFASSADALALLDRLEALDAASATQDYPTLAASIVAAGDSARARSLMLDPACPSDVLAGVAYLLSRRPGADVLEAARARAGHDTFLIALARSCPGEFLRTLGWEVFADPAAAHAPVLGALSVHDVPTLALAGLSITPAQARLVPWTTLREYAARSWFPDTPCPLAAASLSAQAAALTTQRERWEVFASLSADHTGTLGELLDACALVLGELPDCDEDAPAAEPAA